MPKPGTAAKIAAALQQIAQEGFDIKAASKAGLSENEARRKLAAKQEQDDMRDRVRAIIPDFWHHMPSPETCGFQYIDDVPGYVWDVTGDVRKIEDYILPVTGQDRIACKHAALERMENDPITTAETSMQLTKFRRGMKPDAAAFRKVKKAVQHIELDDQKLFDGMDAAFSTQMIEYQTPEGDIVQAPHPVAEFWRQWRPAYICS